MEHFDYKVKQLIQRKIEEQKESLVTQNIKSFDEYRYQLGQLHALERFMLDYQDLYKKVVNDE
jgi:hypothetical protein|tara:strand:+ start:178 stop:366 length:189 start_codon:yes stop_codon:yes gene_type:complete